MKRYVEVLIQNTKNIYRPTGRWCIVNNEHISVEVEWGDIEYEEDNRTWWQKFRRVPRPYKNVKRTGWVWE